MRDELTGLEWAAIVDSRVPDAVQRLLAVRRRAGTQLAHEPPITMWAPDQQRTTPPRSGALRSIRGTSANPGSWKNPPPRAWRRGFRSRASDDFRALFDRRR